MKSISITQKLRVVEHLYHTNKCNLDYAVLFEKNGEERFCGYYKSIPAAEEIDYDALYKAYEANSKMPKWLIDVQDN